MKVPVDEAAIDRAATGIAAAPLAVTSIAPVPVAPAPFADAPIALDADALHEFSWERIFANDGPVEVEIGTGKGGFLLRRARALPGVNFLGIEWAAEFYRFAADRFRRHGLRNVRMLRIDAGAFMQRLCPAASLAALHVYHPDPWPKRRHHKRRLFQPAFVAAAARGLRPGGRLAVQTDHAEYFEHIAEVLRACPLLEEAAFDDPQFGVEQARVATNFEIKYVREGRAIYQLALRRRVDGGR